MIYTFKFKKTSKKPWECSKYFYADNEWEAFYLADEWAYKNGYCDFKIIRNSKNAMED